MKMRHEKILSLIPCELFKWPRLDKLSQVAMIVTQLSSHTFQNSKES